MMLVIAALYGATGVILGAFGAHGLKGRLTPDQLVSFETGVRYQLIHAVLLLVLAQWMRHAPSSLLSWGAALVAAGVFLFSGSIYLLATRDLTGFASARALGPVTPLGGLLLIGGWVLLAVAAWRSP
jgi:uncharacterized membrane protein YgdD (TMEM256/DUF423 family)